MLHFDIFNFFCLQKTATAVAHCKQGCGLIKVNGRPIDQVEPVILRAKVSIRYVPVGMMK